MLTSESGPGASAYDALKELVTNHRLRPNQHLHASELSARLGVSATPVREALLRLYGERLVITNPRRGFYLKPLSVRELSGIYRLCFVVLRHCVETSIQRFSLDGLQVPICLRDSHCSDPDRTTVLRPEDALFIEHLFRRIARLGGNQAAVEVVTNCNDRTHFVRVLDLEEEQAAATTTNDMRDLIYALERRLFDQAIESLQRQFNRTIARMTDLVKEGCARAHRAYDGIS